MKFFRLPVIIGALPITLTNGTTADATQVMADLNWIVNQVNANAADSASVALINANNNFTTVQSGQAATQPANFPIASQVQNSSLLTLSSTLGTNTITARIAQLPLTAYAANQIFTFIPSQTNTGATTLNINGVNPLAVQAFGSALVGGEIRQGVPQTVVHDGAVFQMLNVSAGYYRSMQVFGSSTTWTKGQGLKRVRVTVIGGGGSGGGCAITGVGDAAGAGGGGGGGSAIKTIQAAALNSTETVTVGAGAAAAVAGQNNGNTGATSSFGAHCSATGGGPGIGGNNTATNDIGGGGGAPGVGSNGDINSSGFGGGAGMSFGAMATETAIPGYGGGSILGGSTRQNTVTTTSTGTAGANVGGGSSGAANGSNQAASASTIGATGAVIVEEFY